MRKGAIIRIRIITGAVLVIAAVLLGRLYFLQLHTHELYLKKGEQQYVHTVHDLYDRGSIYFTTKNGERVSAATIQTGFVLVIDATRLEGDAGQVYDALNTLVPIDRETFIKQAGRTDLRYQEVAKQVSEETAEKIKALKLPGVQLYRDQWRYYPGQSLGARTVGFVGYTEASGDEPIGRFGLELYHDEVLSRRVQKQSVDFFAEIFTNLGHVVFDSKPQKSGHIVTSIEPTVARMLDNKLEEINDLYQSKLTGGIIIDPEDGSIYAMNVIPTFNLNDRTGKTIEDFSNPLVQETYEMGSIIKALTVASGLDSGAIAPSTTYYDSGSLELNTLTIRNYDGRGRGTVDMQQVLSQSLNTGVAFIVRTMGNSVFKNYFKALKLDSETGIDLPYESHGSLSNLDTTRDVEFATASFGQGITLTPIATVRALSALGNGGHLVTPHIATHIVYENGKEQAIQYPKGDQVFKPETSEEISRMLTRVVDEALRGGKVKMEHYSIGAKTGTAQMPDSVTRKYSEDRFLHSFFGYFPAYEPRYLIFLYTVEPKGVQYASETLTEPFMDITKFLINYYNVPPDR